MHLDTGRLARRIVAAETFRSAAVRSGPSSVLRKAIALFAFFSSSMLHRGCRVRQGGRGLFPEESMRK
ncbi:hypothetical protein [Amycolatopsis nalaikhensis]|uniref:Uncharacterized protein n=1 Tax=Amycolatopsis nalaikhensis TaxID=715472 RepID=A0ABY8Y0M4_9PSEU|nr:hypothetical protein [Amycolatopsis sp. 2-2]WIV61520.1 hypothetical protein QP939_24395 [Amycolatopsis sp. 2-2]